jgi:hypothetical protein
MKPSDASEIGTVETPKAFCDAAEAHMGRDARAGKFSERRAIASLRHSIRLLEDMGYRVTVRRTQTDDLTPCHRIEIEQGSRSVLYEITKAGVGA